MTWLKVAFLSKKNDTVIFRVIFGVIFLPKWFSPPFHICPTNLTQIQISNFLKAVLYLSFHLKVNLKCFKYHIQLSSFCFFTHAYTFLQFYSREAGFIIHAESTIYYSITRLQ